MRRRLEAARPDVLVMFSNDHLLNWPINNVPEYTVGIAEEHVGPADWFDEWLGMEKYRVPGHSALARFLVNEGARRRPGAGVPGARCSSTTASRCPTHYLNPDARFRLVPVTMNCTVPPIPTPARAYEVGTHPARRRSAPTRAPSASRWSPPAGSRTSRAARATSGWTRSSTAGSSICSSAATTTRCCASARSSAWRRPARAAPPSCWRGSSSSRSRAGPADVLAYMPAIAWRSGTGMVVWNELALTET